MMMLDFAVRIQTMTLYPDGVTENIQDGTACMGPSSSTTASLGDDGDGDNDGDNDGDGDGDV
jgi:hypothetical protein